MRFKFFILIVTTLLFVPYAETSTYVPVDDDVYGILYRLEAEGIIQSGLLTTRPLSRREAARLVMEAERNVEDKSPFLRQLVRTLKRRLDAERDEVKYVKPFDKAYIGYIYSDQAGQELNYNNDGDIYEDGSNLRLGFSSRAELGRFSFYVNPEFRYSQNDEDLVMKEAYGILGFLGFKLEVGKHSQWWGPGYHGAILLSNNAEPLTLLKLTNPHPVLLPWVFRHLGLFRFVFFASRLEEERVVPEPYLWGLRLNFKPIPYLEIGLQRTALLGGKGRPEDLSTWWKSFTGKGENIAGVEAGDQRAGFDVKITLPLEWQPLQLYLEAAGEDEAGGLPSKWAYLTGVYLPRILNFERIDFRAEYATTHVAGSPDVWYSHHIYRSGYRHKGRIIGHHMETNSSDIFLVVNYYLPEVNGRVYVSYDGEKHNLSDTPKPTKAEASVGMMFDLKGDMTSIGGEYTFGELKNTDNLDKKINLFMLKLTYNF